MQMLIILQVLEVLEVLQNKFLYLYTSVIVFREGCTCSSCWTIMSAVAPPCSSSPSASLSALPGCMVTHRRYNHTHKDYILLTEPTQLFFTLSETISNGTKTAVCTFGMLIHSCREYMLKTRLTFPLSFLSLKVLTVSMATS